LYSRSTIKLDFDTQNLIFHAMLTKIQVYEVSRSFENWRQNDIKYISLNMESLSETCATLFTRSPQDLITVTTDLVHETHKSAMKVLNIIQYSVSK
jgi:hypothetical protein